MSLFNYLLLSNLQWNLTVKILIIVLASLALMTATTAFVVEIVSYFSKNKLIIRSQSVSENNGQSATESAVASTYSQPAHSNEVENSALISEQPVEEVPVEVASPVEEAKVVEFNDTAVVPNDGYVEVVSGQTVEIINAEAVEEEAPVAAAPAVQGFVVGGKVIYVRYMYSFMARLAMADDTLKNRYSIIKNELMSYGIKPYMSWGAESFRYGRRTLAKMTIRGKTLNLFLALNTSDYENTKYIYEDVSDVTKYSMVPMRNKIRSDRAVKWAKELIADLANKNSLKSVGHKVESFVPEYQDLDTLIQMGKIKVLTTGNGTEEEVTPADFEALKREKFHTITGMDMVEKVSAEEADVTLSDEVVKEFVQEEHVVVRKNNGKKKKSVGIINVDTLSKNFGAGEEVTLEKLIEKGLLAKSTTGYKVLARGELDKPLKVVSDDFSVQAIKMIVLTGGDAIIKKVDKV